MRHLKGVMESGGQNFKLQLLLLVKTTCYYGRIYPTKQEYRTLTISAESASVFLILFKEISV